MIVSARPTIKPFRTGSEMKEAMKPRRMNPASRVAPRTRWRMGTHSGGCALVNLECPQNGVCAGQRDYSEIPPDQVRDAVDPRSFGKEHATTATTASGLMMIPSASGICCSSNDPITTSSCQRPPMPLPMRTTPITRINTLITVALLSCNHTFSLASGPRSRSAATR